MSDGIVIAGGGLAGQRCAETLRRAGYEGRVRMLCGEPHAPYDRPPLSKAVLASPEAEDRLGLRPASWYADHGVELLLGTRAAALDCARRVVTLGDGDALGYEQLLIATGSRPRRLALLDGSPTSTRCARSRTPARCAPRSPRAGAWSSSARASSARRSRPRRRRPACRPRSSRPPTPRSRRCSGPVVGTWFADLHRSEGVDVILGASVAAATGADRVEQPDPERRPPAGVRSRPRGHRRRPGPRVAGRQRPRPRASSASARRATPARPACSRRATRRAAGTGSRRPARAWPRRARCSASDRPGAPRRASGATSTTRACTTSATRARADAATIDGDPARRDFSVTFTRARRAGRGAPRRPSRTTFPPRERCSRPEPKGPP